MQSPAPHTDERKSISLIEQRLQLLETIRDIVDSELERRERQQCLNAAASPSLATRLREICRSVGKNVARALGI